MAKGNVRLQQAGWLIEPGCVVLISAGTVQRAKLTTVSWRTPVHTSDPCLLLLVILLAQRTEVSGTRFQPGRLSR